MKIDSLAELIQALDAAVDPRTKDEIAALPKESLFKLHFGVNALIRSLAYYKNESRAGKEMFERLGLPDEGSSVLGRIYWLHLRKQPITQDTLVPVIEEHSLFVYGEPAQELARGFAHSYSRLSAL
jgi:hypothetical protein